MLAILCPSRGRPDNLRRLRDAVEATTTDTRIYTRLDDDDPHLIEYATIAGVRLFHGPRVFYGASVNELAAIATQDGATHLAMFGDDVVPETVGWDTMLTTALGGRLGIAYGDDGLRNMHPPDLPTHYVTQTELFTRLGWLVLPTLRHLFADDVARELGKGLNNLAYVDGATLEHRHRWNRKAPDDATYREANDKRKRELDKRAYLTWRNGPGYRAAMEALTA
jgi:hypothetical protein